MQQVQEYDKTVTANCKDNEIKYLQSLILDASKFSFPEVQDDSVTSEATTSVGQVTRNPEAVDPLD